HSWPFAVGARRVQDERRAGDGREENDAGADAARCRRARLDLAMEVLMKRAARRGGGPLLAMPTGVTMGLMIAVLLSGSACSNTTNDTSCDLHADGDAGTGANDTCTAGAACSAPLPSPRAAFAAVTGLDGRIYVIGGDHSAAMDAYDPVSNRWIAL